MRIVVSHHLSELGLNDDVELFPKQDELREDGPGHMMRGPLGMHRDCGERFPSLELSSLEPVDWVDFHHLSGGDAITFYRRCKDLYFLQAVKELAVKYGRKDLIAEIEGRERVAGDDEEVLTDEQLQLLRDAQEGRLPCPDCGEPLQAEFVSTPEVLVGVLLTCDNCPFVEMLTAP